jgi:hypothetical protein
VEYTLPERFAALTPREINTHVEELWRCCPSTKGDHDAK